MARIFALLVILYTGPAPVSPAQQTSGAITVIVPANLASSVPSCAVPI